MRFRLHNKVGMWIDIPSVVGDEFKYHRFYLNHANQVMRKAINGKQVQVLPPYVLHKHFLGTDKEHTQEVVDS